MRAEEKAEEVAPPRDIAVELPQADAQASTEATGCGARLVASVLKKQETPRELSREQQQGRVYRQIWFAIAFQAVLALFMSFEDSETIANIHPKIRTFLQGTSPACIESDAASNCVRWDEISSWTSMGKWVDQSIISPIWGDYGDGELGVILQYLSVGKQLVFWTRRYVRAQAKPW